MKKILLSLLLLSACAHKTVAPPTTASLHFPEEKHLRNIRQLTFGGQNAEAYFSQDGQWLIFQSQRDGAPCDQMYVMRTDGSELRRVSTGTGRTTCGYLYGTDKNGLPENLIFASTHGASAECPQAPDHAHGYAWGIFPTYDLYTNTFKGDGPLHQLTNFHAYTAEATISPDQKKIVFTSTKNGDLDLYTMDVNGKHLHQVTKELGYDGGAYFFHDGKRIIYRAFHPETPEEKKSYSENLKNHLYRPTWLELFWTDLKGKEKHQITHFHAGTFAPFMFPSDKRVIFSSNKNDPQGRHFDIYAVDLDGNNLEQITFSHSFDSFPMFSPDGKQLVWASNRNGKAPHETNVFIADWIE